MKINCVWEHNGNDSLLFAQDFPGAFTRGESLETAVRKMPAEIASYLKWSGQPLPKLYETIIVQQKESDLAISDADSDVLFEQEQAPLTLAEYQHLKTLALKSAKDFLTLYQSIPDKDKSCLAARKTFYGQIPRTATEMYLHTRNVNDYYFAEIGVQIDHEGPIAECRQRGFKLLEKQPGFLSNPIFCGSYDEQWSLRKLMRRFIWHDRIHAKAMYRMAIKTFGNTIPDIFHFTDT